MGRNYEGVNMTGWQRWEQIAFGLVTVVSAVAIGIISWQVREQNQAIETNAEKSDMLIRTEVKRNCIELRELFQQTILRTLDASYEEYQRDPGQVLETYRKQLETNPSFKGNNARVERSVLVTHDILQLSDPELCK
jgi:hypothetical protein